jgi:hypothetical protein
MAVLVEPGHEIISGTIGMGKSFWVLYKIVQSLAHDRPCCYIDPKGDTYRALLAYLLTDRRGQRLWQTHRHRILLLNPLSNSDHLLGFNAIEPMGNFFQASPDRIALVATAIVSHIKRQAGWDIGMANRMEAIMLAAIGLLVQSGRYTLAEVPMLFLQTYDERGKPLPFNPFTQSLLDELRHPGTRAFWEYQWANWTIADRREWVNSTDNQIFRYLFDERSLLTVCTGDNQSLDFRRLVDGRYWLFVNLPYPFLSETVTSLLGNLIISKLFYACLQREPTHDYRLILDEARFFNTGPLDVILETSRAFRLWLTLVVQSFDQMARSREGFVDWHLKETALNNTRYLSIFQNVADSADLARLLFPLTGQVPISLKVNGDPERLPIPAEIDRNQRRLMGLRRRQVLIYDRLYGEPRTWITPEIRQPPVEPERLALFEGEHLQLTGRPVSEIRREIAERQARLKQKHFGAQTVASPEKRKYGEHQWGRRI